MDKLDESCIVTDVVDDIDLNYGNYGIFLVMGSAGFSSSTVLLYF